MQEHQLPRTESNADLNLGESSRRSVELEGALFRHPKVSEVAVVPVSFASPHAFDAFITLKQGVVESDELRSELSDYLREEIGPGDIPERFVFRRNLPKTRSGKLLRFLLQESEGTDQGGAPPG